MSSSLCFFPWNDLTNNSYWYARDGFAPESRPYFVEQESGLYSLKYPEQTYLDKDLLSARWNNFWNQYAYTYRALSHLVNNLGEKTWNARHRINKLWHYMNVFRPSINAEWVSSWNVTEYILRLLKVETEKDAAELMVIEVPAPIQFDEQQFEKLMPPAYGFDPLFPHTRLKEICKRLNIKYWSLYEYFVDYKHQHQLSYPFFRTLATIIGAVSDMRSFIKR